jgi:putative two-component system response regulator
LLYQTCPLHDIGKVAIPDHVLLKAGRLDSREYEIMKTHTGHGAATLDSALRHYPEADFLRMARDIAACHHERYDGKGYPQGLVGEEIPLAARIFAVADVYDALVSKRIYKPAYTHDVAYNIIVQGSGRQFDPDVVEAFKRCEGVFRSILEGTQEFACESGSRV